MQATTTILLIVFQNVFSSQSIDTLNSILRFIIKFLQIPYNCDIVGRVRHENPEREFPNSQNYSNFLIACKCSALTRSTGPRRRDIGLFIRVNVIPGLFSVGYAVLESVSRSSKISHLRNGMPSLVIQCYQSAYTLVRHRNNRIIPARLFVRTYVRLSFRKTRTMNHET